MSNDSKFWLARALVFACIAVNLTLLAAIQGAAMDPMHTHLKLLVVIFVIVLILSFPAALYYYAAKARRWENEDTQDQIALETLSKLGEKRQQQRERTRNNNS